MEITPPLKIYLDVDGVLNAWWADLIWPTKDYGVANGYKIIYSPEMIAALDQFVEDTGAQIVWTTTWCGDAPTKLAPVVGLKAGLPEASTVLMPLSGEVSFPSILWKRDAIRADQEANPGPFIHIDDEVDDSGWGSGKPDGGLWQKAVTEMGGIALAPSQQGGIAPNHIFRMREYVASLAASPAEDVVE